MLLMGSQEFYDYTSTETINVQNESTDLKKKENEEYFKLSQRQMQEIVVLKRKLKDKENNSRKTIIFYFQKSFLCRESFLTISKNDLD